MAQLAGDRRLGGRGEQETGSAAAIETFKNTELGETWRASRIGSGSWSAGTTTRLARSPPGGLLLVRRRRPEKSDQLDLGVCVAVKASWLVEHRILMGDTAREAVWRDLGALLAEQWTHASGTTMPLARFALDTGFATQEAYAFVQAAQDSRLMAVKGIAEAGLIEHAPGGGRLAGRQRAPPGDQGLLGPRRITK